MRLGPENLTKPSMTVSSDASQDVSRRITYIDRRIHERPADFIVSLNANSELATSQTVDLGDRDDSVRSLGRKPADLIIEFFRKRYDLDIIYDENTEGVIADDPRYKQLVANMRSKTADRIQTGTMKSENRPSLEAVPARDLVRVRQLSIYLGQVIEYRDQQQTQIQESGIGLQEVSTNLPANGTTGMGGA